MKLLSLKRKQAHYVIVIFCCCCLIVCSVGNTFNCAGLFYSPISQELNVGIGQVSFYITIASLICGLGAPLAIKCFDRLKTRGLLACAAAVTIGCYILLSQVKNLILLYFCSVLLGISTCFYGVPVAAYFISNWFEAKYDVVTGLVFSFGGIGGALLNPFYSAVMERIGWRNTYLCSAAVVFVLLLPCIVLLQRDPGFWGLSKYGENSNLGKQRGQGKKNGEVRSPVSRNAVMVICCIVGFLGFFVTSYVTHFKTYTISLGNPIAVGVTMTTVAMLANCSCKFLAGVFCEKFGGLYTGIAMLLLGVIGIIIISVSPGRNLAFYFAAFLIGAVYSVPSVCLSAIGKTFFDSAVFASMYSVIQVFASLGSASGYFFIGQLYDITGSYKTSSVLCLCFLLISLLFLTTLFIIYKKVVDKKGAV